MTVPPGFYPIFSIPFGPNQLQDGVSLALIGSLNPSWLQREDVGGRQSVLIGQAWVTHILGAEGMSAPLDHRAEEGSGRRCVSLRGIMGQTGLPRWLLPMQEMLRMLVQSLGLEDPLEEEVASHSRILARTIPWAEEPGRLQSMGSPRVRYD